MKHYFAITITIVTLLSLQACNNSEQNQINDDSKVLAGVGDVIITEAYLAAFLSSQGVQQPNEQQKAQGLDVLVKQASLAQLAKKSGIGLSQQHSFEIQQAKQRALAQAAIDQHLADNPISDADIKAEYQRIVDELDDKQYHVRHLLFQDESQALETLDQIKVDHNYSAAEAAYLSAHAGVKNVGDIGWVNIMQVPEVFRGPLQNMQAGTTHPKTLVSQYGVHVLHLEAVRPLVKPEITAVEAGIRQTLKQRKIDRYQQLAVIKAKAKKTE